MIHKRSTLPRQAAASKEQISESLTSIRSLEQRNGRKGTEALLNAVGLSSPLAKDAICDLAEFQVTHSEVVAPWFELWREHCEQYFDLTAAEQILADLVPASNGSRLFTLQSYCKLLLIEFLRLTVGITPTTLLPAGANLFGWLDRLYESQFASLGAAIRQHIARTTDLASLDAVSGSDLLATLYQEMLPPSVRHLLGEYYTPSWLVEYCIRSISRLRPDAGKLTILDPAAGSGSFLAHCVAHLQRLSLSDSTVVGFDINPLAVEFCRGNVLFASARKALQSRQKIKTVVHLADAVVDPLASSTGPLFGRGSAEKTILGITFRNEAQHDRRLYERAVSSFSLDDDARQHFLSTLRQYVADCFASLSRTDADVIVGNPPWITWDGLLTAYRNLPIG
jgi:N-6 DNA Methylase